MKQEQRDKREFGQSLVEVALFLPIFVILIAGVVEISQLLITKNRVSTASREAARFAANGGEDEGLKIVALNTMTQTLNMDENLWDIWAVRGKVNDDASDIEEWEFNHIYGLGETEAYSDVNGTAIQGQVLNQLRETGDPSGTRFAGTYVQHDVETILGLEQLPYLQDFNSVSSLNVMRITGRTVVQTEGCSGFPIAVHVGARSVTGEDSGGNPYPDPDEFDYPDPPPDYDDFYLHDENVPLEDAEEGYLYLLQNGFGNGNFGWLHWNEGRPADANRLAESLSWPGDSNDYSDHGDSQIYAAADAYPWIVRGYVEPGDPSDTSMHIGDWVAANTGSVNANQVRSALEENIDKERTLRLIIWDDSAQQGNNGRYRIKGFATFKLIGYRLSQGQGGSWILGEFVRWDNTCGQEEN